jgi:hypothetical protein
VLLLAGRGVDELELARRRPDELDRGTRLLRLFQPFAQAPCACDVERDGFGDCDDDTPGAGDGLGGEIFIDRGEIGAAPAAR